MPWLSVQELFATPYFCQEQSEEHVKIAQVSARPPGAPSWNEATAPESQFTATYNHMQCTQWQ